MRAAAAIPGISLHPLMNPLTGTGAALVGYEAFSGMHIDHEREPTSLAAVVASEGFRTVREASDGGTINVRQGGEFTPAEHESLWSLFGQRFVDISDNSPINLEEDKTSTVEHLFKNPDYSFVFHADPEGIIDACSFLTDDRDSYDWISPDFLDARDQAVLDTVHEKPYEVFVPGVAALKTASISASKELFDVMSSLIAATNHPYSMIRFECTDVSSLYVPSMVKSGLARNPAFVPVDFSEMGRKNYYAVKISA